METVYTDVLGDTMSQLTAMQDEYYQKYQYDQSQEAVTYNLEQWSV